MEPQRPQAISFSAFVDAVEEYEKDTETDDEGDMMEAQQKVKCKIFQYDLFFTLGFH